MWSGSFSPSLSGSYWDRLHQVGTKQPIRLDRFGQCLSDGLQPKEKLAKIVGNSTVYLFLEEFLGKGRVLFTFYIVYVQRICICHMYIYIYIYKLSRYIHMYMYVCIYIHFFSYTLL